MILFVRCPGNHCMSQRSLNFQRISYYIYSFVSIERNDEKRGGGGGRRNKEFVILRNNERSRLLSRISRARTVSLEILFLELECSFPDPLVPLRQPLSLCSRYARFRWWRAPTFLPRIFNTQLVERNESETSFDAIDFVPFLFLFPKYYIIVVIIIHL